MLPLAFMKISLFVMDVDGTLTDGRFTMDEYGNETKTFNVKDGMGVKLLRKAGIRTAIISGRPSKVVERRAESLQIDHCIFSNEKLASVLTLAKKEGISLEQIAYIGDDLNDQEVFEQPIFCGCPQDACNPIKHLANYVCKTKGGHGAVREFADYILGEHNT